MATQQSTKPAGKSTQGNKDGHDLTTILDQSQRADLTLLIANVSESMRQLLLDNFDASAGLDKGLLNIGQGETSEEKLMNAPVDPGSADVDAYDRERKLLEQYEKDLTSDQMTALKKDALQAYDTWRENVLQRVGQVVNSQGTDQKQSKTSSSDSARPQAPQTSGKVTKGAGLQGNVKFKDLFPPTKTPLTKMDMEKRTLILHSILLLLLSLEHYDAPSRILLLNLTSSLKLPLKVFEQDEYATAKGLLEAAKEMTASDEAKHRAEENKESRKWKVGLATAAGAAIIGVTGGLAAPMVAAGVGSVMGGLGLGATAAAGYLGSVAGSTVLVGGLFGAYGGRMTGQMMDNYAREVEDFAFLPVHSGNKTSEDEKEGAKQASQHDHKLRVTVCISGWLTEKEEVVKPWRVLGRGAEVFALKYELEALLNLGNAMNGLVQSAAWGYAQKQLIAQTIFADLASAFWPIGLAKAARVIDNPFSVAKARSDKAGEILADALIKRAQGERPVTLIGYSLGARVIYSCLMSLARRKTFGLIESVVMMGSPTPSDTNDWRIMRTVVSGRLINVFSQNDYFLGFMYRTSSLQYGVAGLQRVNGLPGVENVDVSEDVSGHTRYRYLVGSILKKVGFEDVDMQAVEEERVALQKMEAEEKKNSLQAQRNRLIRRQSTGGKEDEAAEAEAEAGEIEKQVQAKTQQSLTTRVIQWWYTPSVPSTKDIEKAAANAQKAANDPKDAANAAKDTADDVRASSKSYAQWAAERLPSMPGMPSRSSAAGQPTKAVSDAPKSAGDATKKTPVSAPDPKKALTDTAASAQSYATRAAGYLPSMSNLPSMPTMTGRGKPAAAPTDAGKKATSTAKTTADPQTKQATNPGSRTSDSTRKASGTGKQAPIIHQATEKPPVAGGGGGGASDKQATASKKDNSQSYTSYASSYLPSIPKSMPSIPKSIPSLPTFRKSSAAKAPDPSEKGPNPPPPTNRATSSPKKQIPKLDRKPSGVDSSSPAPAPPTPKLDRTPSSGVRSPPPKLDRRTTPSSGVKSPPPKLNKIPSSGPVKSSSPAPPPPKLDRQASGMKSPPVGNTAAK